MTALKRQFAIISLFVLVLGSTVSASAEPMDLALSRLRLPSGGQALPGGGVTCSGTGVGGGVVTFCPDNDDWRRLMSQQGFALAPPILSPARTVGYRGFYLGIETGSSGIAASSRGTVGFANTDSTLPNIGGRYGPSEYWHRGTEGDSRATFEEGNRFVDSSVTWMRLAMRKGLPFGFELGASIGRPFHSSLWMWGLSVKWSLLEGFDHGLPAIVPDIAVRGSVHTMSGDGQYNLTVPSLDLIVSKGIVLGSQATLTPIIGAQLMWIVADSELVDLNPEADSAFDSCPQLPNSTATTGGTPCPSGSSAHFNDRAVFDQVRARRTRIALGMQLRFRALTIAATFHFDLKSPHAMDSSMPADLPRQWNVSSAIGLTY